MIIDNIRNITFYEGLLPGLLKALEAIEDQYKLMEPGRYEYEDGFFMVQKGQTKPMQEGLFEAHRKYIDVQIVVHGEEEIAWAELHDTKLVTPYNEEKDASYYEGDESHHMKISEGMFYVANPHDAHKAVRHTDSQHTFEKIVIKIPI